LFKKLFSKKKSIKTIKIIMAALIAGIPLIKHEPFS